MPVPLRLAAWFPAGAGRPAGGRHFCLPGGRSGRGGRAPAPRYNVLARHSETGARRASRRDRPITRPQEGSRGAKAGIQADAPETPPGPMSRAMNIAALQAFPVDVRRQKSATGARQLSPVRRTGHWRGHRGVKDRQECLAARQGSLSHPGWRHGSPLGRAAPRAAGIFVCPVDAVDGVDGRRLLDTTCWPATRRPARGGRLGETALSPDLRKARAARRRESRPTHRRRRPAR